MEAMYLLSFSPGAQDGLLQMIERGALHVLALGAEDLPPIRAIMRKYADRPMDFAESRSCGWQSARTSDGFHARSPRLRYLSPGARTGVHIIPDLT